MKKDSIVFVVAGPNMPSSLFVQQDNERKVTNQFTLKDLALSRVYYQVTESLEDDDDDGDVATAAMAAMTTGTKSDFVQLMFVAPDNQTIHSVLIEFEIGGGSIGGLGGLRGVGKGKDDSLLSRSIKGLNGPPSVYSGQVAQTKRVRMICFG